MDERLEKALDFSNYMITLNNQKRILKEKFREQTIYYYKGSQFTVSKELMTFVNVLVDKGFEEVILIDDNETPTMIGDLVDFNDNIFDVYFSATNSFHAAYEEIRKNRSVEKLTDYD
jgi:hypothetical protein